MAPVESCIIHPLVLLNVVDHYNRVARDTSKRVVGVLLGTIDLLALCLRINKVVHSVGFLHHHMSPYHIFVTETFASSFTGCMLGGTFGGNNVRKQEAGILAPTPDRCKGVHSVQKRRVCTCTVALNDTCRATDE